MTGNDPLSRESAHALVERVQTAWAARFETTLRSALEIPDVRLPLLEIARSVDAAVFRGWTHARPPRGLPPLFRLTPGWGLASQALIHACAPHLKHEGTPLIPSSGEKESWAQSVLMTATVLRMFDAVLASPSLARWGDDSITTRCAPLSGWKTHAADVAYWRSTMARTTRGQRNALLTRRNTVVSAMRDSCWVWHEQFPAYRADERVVDWYTELAMLEVSCMAEAALLPEDIGIPGISSEMIVRVIMHLVSTALMHLDYCAILAQKHPALRWQNLLTVTQDRSLVIEQVAALSDIPLGPVSLILDLLTANGGAVQSPGAGIAPLPSFIRTSSNQHVRLVSGVLGEPLRHVMWAIRSRHPGAWHAQHAAWAVSAANAFQNILTKFGPVAGRPHVLRAEDGACDLEFASTIPEFHNSRPTIAVVPAWNGWEDPGAGDGDDVPHRTTGWLGANALSFGSARTTGTVVWDAVREQRTQRRCAGVPFGIDLSSAELPLHVWSDSLANEDAEASFSEFAEAAIAACVREEREFLRQIGGNGTDSILELISGADRSIPTPLLLPFESLAKRVDPDLSRRDGGMDGPGERSTAGEEPNVGTPSLDQFVSEHDKRIVWRYGYQRALSLVMRSAPRQDGSPLDPTERSQVDDKAWAMLAMARVGEAVALRRLSRLTREGLTHAHQTATHRWELRVPPLEEQPEHLEARHIGVVAQRIRESSERLASQHKGLHDRAVRDLLDSTSLLDDGRFSLNPSFATVRYFVHIARMASAHMLAYDAFASETLFGGLPFSDYRAVGIGLMAEAMMRVLVDDALGHIDPGYEQDMLKTSGWQIPLLSARLAAVLDMKSDDVGRILTCYTLVAEAAEDYGNSEGAAWPPLVQDCPFHVIMSSGGCLDGPFQFLLIELRRRFPKDWDRALESREPIFRNDLYEVVTSTDPERFITAPSGIKLRENGRVLTDIDAAIFDRHTGDLGLFQLKWHDMIGPSVRRRASVARNFTRESNEWVARVTAWLSNRSASDLQATFHLPSEAAVVRPRLFVLGRAAARFSGIDAVDARAVVGTWHAVLVAIAATNETPSGTSPLGPPAPLRWLSDHLADAHIPQQPPSAPRSETIMVGGLTVTMTEQASKTFDSDPAASQQ